MRLDRVEIGIRDECSRPQEHPVTDGHALCGTDGGTAHAYVVAYPELGPFPQGAQYARVWNPHSIEPGFGDHADPVSDHKRRPLRDADDRPTVHAGIHTHAPCESPLERESLHSQHKRADNGNSVDAS